MSYTSLSYHVVFSSKGRRGVFDEDKMRRVCAYIGGIVRNLEGRLYVANGVADHIHIAVSLKAGVSPETFVRIVKTNTSRWIHETFEDMGDFGWQDGYSAFTVSYSGVGKVIDYIKRQQEHHREMTFEKELVSLLEKHDVDFDERYVCG